MSIITGMYSPTKGAVFINGKDVVNKFREVREGIGFCSQYNLSFPYLTIKENIKFFHMLKTTQHDDDLTLEQLLKKLKLKDKANLFTSDLSSGMLRCLQVACSLASGAEVLVLDEPTSGMDVEIRHRLWDLFMVLRGNKTIIMTTGCLEEATALGDRIVILNNGILRCHGTPMFLKHALGVSCNLSVTLTDSSHMMYLIDIVEDLIPDVRHRIEDIKRVTFSLPSKEHDKFPEMFKALEKNKAVLGIVLIDVGMFMEEVFLEFVDEEDDEEYDMEMNLSCRHMKMDQISGFRLTITRIKLLISRIYEYMLLRKYQCLIWQVIVPIVGFFLITLTTNDCLGYGKMFSHHEFYHPEIKAIVYNEGPFRRSGINESLHKFPKLNAVHSKDIDKDFSDRKTYKSHKSIGIKMMEHYTRVFHPHEPYLVSKSINIHSNIYMSVHMPYLNQSIITKYEPIRKKGKAPIDPKSVFLCLKWSIWVVFLSIMPLAPFITLSIKEHYEGTRDNHMMAGCSPMIHWGSKFIAHMAGYLLIIPAPLIVLTVALDLDKTFNQPRFIGAFAMILLAFGPAFLAHIYFLSFIFQVKYAICQVYIMSMVLGTIFPIAVAVLEPVWKAHTVLTITYLTLTIVARISPLFAYTDGLARVTLQARSNAFCRLNKHMCPNLTSRELSFYPEICCNSPSTMPFRYMEDYVTGLHDFLTLIIQFFIYSVLVILLEHRIPQYIIERIMTCQYRVPRHKFFSVSVSKEADYVRSKLRAGQTKHDVILAHNLHKTFKNIFNKKHKCEPIKGISFSGKMGECIGFVGPQDVGKSTLLMMLTGLLVMTRGNCVVKGQHIRKNRSKYVRNICFASQSFGMDTFRTGVQNLTFLAMLQGYSKEMAIRISLLSLHFMGLHANASMVKQYSAGCVRRLGLCAALVLAPALAVLDEPMLDVDHNSRSRVAKALQRLVLEPAVVIVAEASVDWGHMESVYSRMAILSQGELAALGPAGDIHARVANGYTARIKLKVYSAYREDREKALDDDDDSSSSSESDAAMHSEKSVMHAQGIVAFKRDFMRIFPESSILGEHLCMLYFHIEDPENNLTYSEMFARLEKLRAKHDDTVEDYILSSTTIEDVFWRLKKEPFKRESITGPVEYV
ncbi:unnamed protein product [Chrysodeixis includens]|uniref:ABC transporter domain-containing protein n=1 Tax=Chrysodeixis includens TaxID=689277 RepID=A0A9P0BKE0_CHRIL|nr:unnamed protein product [Chrysodeixis includens]